MVILQDGRRFGSISGGCLEGDVCRKAWWFTEDRKPAVRVYDTSADDEVVWEFGLGCKGQVHLLFERVNDAGTAEMLRFLTSAGAARRPVVVATIIASGVAARVGDRLLFDADGVRGGSLAGSALESDVLAQVRECYLQQRSHLARLPGMEVFVESIAPALSLIVFGAGHDAQPLVRFAGELGWKVTVADGRANYATRERFPEASRVVVLDPKEPLRGIEVTRETAMVFLTHNYNQDLALLRHVLPLKPRYLGLLGPKSRAEELLAEVALPVTGIDVHAPIGLDLGSDAPVSIALAVVAEIQAVVCGRDGGKLRERQAPIHDPAIESGIADEQLAVSQESAICELS